MNSNLDIIYFGDSLTYGYGVPKEKSWVYKASHELHLNYINKGKNGDTTSAMLARYSRDVLQYSPSIIFIMGGTNDLLCGRNLNYIIDNMEIMIKDALDIKAQVIIGIPPIILGDIASDLFCPSSFYSYTEKNLPLLRKSLIKLCNKYSVIYTDFYSLELNDKNLFIDGIHLNSNGNDLLSKCIIKIFKSKCHHYS